MKALNKPVSVVLCAAFVLATANLCRAEILAIDLFDNISSTNDAALNGQSYVAQGFTGAWTAHSALLTSNIGSDVLPDLGLPSQEGAVGKVWSNVSYNWSSDVYAARELTSAAQIDMAQDGVYYFSFKGYKRTDVAGFMGFSTGPTSSDSFISVGWTWDNARELGGDPQAAPTIHQSSYIGQGTLGADNGAYGIRVAGVDNTIVPGDSVLMVGQIVTSASGDDQIFLKVYKAGDTVDTNDNAVSWTLSYSFASSDLLTHLILGSNGEQPGELDAFRLGTTWASVVPEPGSLSLLAAALLGLLAYAWRRK